MQKNITNLVVKTVFKLDIRVKSYHKKINMKNHLFSHSLPLTWQGMHAASSASVGRAGGPPWGKKQQQSTHAAARRGALGCLCMQRAGAGHADAADRAR